MTSELEKISHYRLRKSDFAGADQDSVAALAVLSYAVSELSVLLRQYLFIEHDFVGPDEFDQINYFQRNVLLRVFSAKLFEAERFICLEGKYNKTNSQELKAIFQPFKLSSRWLRRHPGYDLVRQLRNEATSHYHLSPAKKNLAAVPDNADFSFILHKMEGNSLYLMGEAVMHYGKVWRHAKQRGNDTLPYGWSEYDAWMHWNLMAFRWLKRAHLKLSIKLTLESFDGRTARERLLWLPEGTSAIPKDRLTPVFVRGS